MVPTLIKQPRPRVLLLQGWHETINSGMVQQLRMLGGLGRQRRLCHVLGQWRKGTSETKKSTSQSGRVTPVHFLDSVFTVVVNIYY